MFIGTPALSAVRHQSAINLKRIWGNKQGILMKPEKRKVKKRKESVEERANLRIGFYMIGFLERQQR